jgi:hypothetical protein
VVHAGTVDIQWATESHIDEMVALQVERNGPECGAMIRALVADPAVGIENCTVAIDRGRVVSSICLMAESFALEGITIPVGQPEFVATAEGYGHQGLIRQQMAMVHDRSQERGDLTQIIAGIPYFYRRFGYEYAIGAPSPRLLLPNAQVTLPDGWRVREAVTTDVAAIMALELHTQAGIPLTSTRSGPWWQWWLGADAPGGIYVALHDGVVHGVAWFADGLFDLGPSVTVVLQPAVRLEDALWALLAEAAGREGTVAVAERAGLTRLVYSISIAYPRPRALYVRVPDLAALLRRIRPVLSARLARSAFSGTSGSLLLSSYAASIVLTYQDGEIVEVEAGPPEQNPNAKGGAGVPPDLVATLVFGRYGASGLAARHDDVRLGRAAELMEVLFPKLETDIITSL